MAIVRRRPPKPKLSEEEKLKRALRKQARAVLRQTVTTSSLMTEPIPAFERVVFRPSRGDSLVPRALREQVGAILLERIRFARSHWRKPFRVPTLSFDLRGTTAGTADVMGWHIQLNPVLLVENPAEMTGDTLGHELAHLLDAGLHGGDGGGHGPTWKQVMRHLGLNPDRTHTMAVDNAVVGREIYKYRCSCQDWFFKPPEHRKFQSGRTTAKCKQCLRPVRYTGDVRLAGVWKKALESSRPPLQEARPPTLSARPVLPPRPPNTARTPAPPSAAALQYAAALALRLNATLPQNARNSAHELSQFIDQAKALLAATSAPAGGLTQPDQPSERQLAFAQAIATRRQVALPPEVARSRKALSSWIDRYKG